jgi:enoyl-CoA hydratase
LKATAASVMDRGAALENLSFMTNDSRIAFEAFADKRRPKFTGS